MIVYGSTALLAQAVLLLFGRYATIGCRLVGPDSDRRFVGVADRRIWTRTEPPAFVVAQVRTEFTQRRAIGLPSERKY